MNSDSQFNTNAMLLAQKNMIDFWSSQVGNILEMAEKQQLTMIEQQLSKALEKGKISKESANTIKSMYHNMYSFNRQLNKINTEYFYNTIQEAAKLDNSTAERLANITSQYNQQLQKHLLDFTQFKK